MKKIIFRKPFISEESRNYGTLWYDKGQWWLKTMTFTDDEEVISISKGLADMYLDKARRALGFYTVEDMNKYYQLHRKF